MADRFGDLTVFGSEYLGSAAAEIEALLYEYVFGGSGGSFTQSPTPTVQATVPSSPSLPQPSASLPSPTLQVTPIAPATASPALPQQPLGSAAVVSDPLVVGSPVSSASNSPFEELLQKKPSEFEKLMRENVARREPSSLFEELLRRRPSVGTITRGAISRASILIGGILDPSPLGDATLPEAEVKRAERMAQTIRKLEKRIPKASGGGKPPPPLDKLTAVQVEAARRPLKSAKPAAARPSGGSEPPRKPPGQTAKREQTPKKRPASPATSLPKSRQWPEWWQVLLGDVAQTVRRSLSDPRRRRELQREAESLIENLLDSVLPGTSPLQSLVEQGLTAIEPSSVRSPLPRASGAGMQPPSQVECKVRTRSKRRKCRERANVVWASGPRKGEIAGTKCLQF